MTDIHDHAYISSDLLAKAKLNLWLELSRNVGSLSDQDLNLFQELTKNQTIQEKLESAKTN